MRANKITIISAIVLLIFTTGSILEAQTPAQSDKKTPEGKDSLEMIPADCLGCARINNLNHTLTQADKFTEGLVPMPEGIKQTVISGISNIIGNPNMVGINLSGNFSCFLEAGKNSNPPKIFFLVPVTDYQQLLTNSAVFTTPDSNGISSFNLGGKNAVIKRLGDVAVFTKTATYEDLLQFTGKPEQSLADALGPDELEKARGKTLWVYANVKKVNEKYGEFILQQFERAKQIFEEAQKQSMTGNPTMQSSQATVMNLYFEMLKTFLNEVEYFNETLELDSNLLSLKGCIAARENTDTAEIFTKTESISPNPLLGYLENGSVFNFAFNMDSKLFTSSQLKSMEFMGIDPNQEINKEMEKLLQDSLKVFGQWGVCSCKTDSSQTPPFVIKYVTELDDPAMLDEVIDRGEKLWQDEKYLSAMAQFGIKMNYSIRKDTGSYKGVSIDSAKLILQPVDSNSPEAITIKQMYGDGLNYRWGVVDGKSLVCGIGTEPNEIIRELIDRVKAGEGKMLKSETRQAINILGGNPAKADIMGTFNYLRAINFAFSFMPIPAKPDSQTAAPFGQSSSNIAFSGTAQNNKLIINLAIPKKHLQEITNAFMMLQQQQMQQNPQFQQPPKPDSDYQQPNNLKDQNMTQTPDG